MTQHSLLHNDFIASLVMFEAVRLSACALQWWVRGIGRALELAGWGCCKGLRSAVHIFPIMRLLRLQLRVYN